MSSSSGSSSKSSPGRCAFCGKFDRHEQHLTSTSTPIVAYGSPPAEGKGAFAKLKPLRWRFLTNKGPRSKYMCTACADKRQVASHHKAQQPVGLDSSWPDGARSSTDVQKPRQREEQNSKLQREPGQALKLEHLLEPNDKLCQQRRSRSMQQTAQVQPEKREKLQELQQERQEDQTSTLEQPRSDGRRRRCTQTPESHQESARRSSVLHPFANHRASRESILRNRPVSTTNLRARSTSTSKPRAASVDNPVRPRKSSNGQSEPRQSEKKDARRSQTDQRLSSTADILGMSRSLELPPNYFDMSSASPAFTAPEHGRLDLKQLETQLPHVEPRENETEEERQRRRTASYAQMLVRMRRHYDAVQVNGTHAAPTTAPPRRVRAERRAKSVAHRNFKADAAMDNPATFAIDLDYLRAYKDAH